MNQARETYKRIRLLTGGVVPVALAVGLLVFSRGSDPSWEVGAQVAGICRELMAGTTVGRQALFGSCWIAPLPVLVYLPFVGLFAEPVAGWIAFVVSACFLFWTLREAFKASEVSPFRLVLTQTAVAVLLATLGPADVLQIPVLLAAGCCVLAVAGLADWVRGARLRDIVVASAAGAMMVFCGFAFFIPACMLVGLLPLTVLGRPDLRARLPAWILLGGLPLLYTIGVWMLLNRLVLGDSLFFLRSVSYITPRVGFFVLAMLAPVAGMVPLLLITWKWGKETGARKILLANIVRLSVALALLVWSVILKRFNLDWLITPVLVSACVLFLVTLAHLQQSKRRLVLVMVLFILLAPGWFRHGVRVSRAQDRKTVCQAVASCVEGRTPYGRVFVLGYAGMDLLREYRGDLMQANLDLHLGTLRVDYKGQNLYVLVPRPEGVNRAESVFWRYPNIYALGTDRLSFIGAFGSWHLFELIAAPTQEQLDAWKAR